MKNDREKILKLLFDELEQIKNDKLRENTKELLAEIDKVNKTLNPFAPKIVDSPASKRTHHSHEGGLLLHTYAVLQIAKSLADIVESVYNVQVDRDIIIAAAILHDIMKPATYRKINAEYHTSDLGNKLDHLTLIVSEMYKRNFPIEVIHAVAGHHGNDGSTWPRSIEALIVHLADSVDSSLISLTLSAAQNLIKRTLGFDVRIEDSTVPMKVINEVFYNGRDILKDLWEKWLKNDKSVRIKNSKG
ncbi:MAG: HD domain-containing protein [Candidatus Asgardarchaeia archaeon]